MDKPKVKVGDWIEVTKLGFAGPFGYTAKTILTKGPHKGEIKMATDPDDMLNEANEMAREQERAHCGDDGFVCGLPGCPNCDEIISPDCPECGAPLNSGKCAANCQQTE
jgi:hypothetical protein